MISRALPEPDRYAVCPNDGAVLPFYLGVFEAVYVLLHPFIRPTGISADSFRSEQSLSRSDLCATRESVKWSEVQQLGGFSSMAEIDIALRTQIGGLKEGFADPALAARLQACVAREPIFQPTEGEFSDLTHNKVLTLLQDVGHSWVWVGDEFGTERKLQWIDDLKRPASDATEGRRSVFTADKSVLWTTHWDSHFAFVCGSNRLIDRLANDDRLEGFRCDAGTEVYWSLQAR